MAKPKSRKPKFKAGVERVTIKGHDFVITTSAKGKRSTKTAQEYAILEAKKSSKKGK